MARCIRPRGVTADLLSSCKEQLAHLTMGSDDELSVFLALVIADKFEVKLLKLRLTSPNTDVAMVEDLCKHMFPECDKHEAVEAVSFSDNMLEALVALKTKMVVPSRSLTSRRTS